MPLHPPAASRSDALAQVGDRALERASGAPASEGNAVELLLDAEQNFPAWLAAIRAAERQILFEMYIFAPDDVGREFADALAAKAREGVRVCVLYDWLGSSGMHGLAARMREAGVDVRVFNPPRLDSPLGWFTRDHRKTIAIDGKIGFVSGPVPGADPLGRGIARPYRTGGAYSPANRTLPPVT